MIAQKLDAATLRRIAVRGSCSPGTVQKVYMGLPVRGLAYYRALAALHEANLRPQAGRQMPTASGASVPNRSSGSSR